MLFRAAAAGHRWCRARWHGTAASLTAFLNERVLNILANAGDSASLETTSCRDDEGASVRVAVTGAFGFSGRYFAQRLLALRHEVITLTNSPNRPNPFGGSIKAFPYNFSEPHALEKSLRGTDVLVNTYWVRFDNPPHFTFARAVANSKVLFDAAKRAACGACQHY